MGVALFTVVESSIFSRRAEVLLSELEHDRLVNFLAANPFAGDEIVGSGGVRKLRFAAKGKGKSGGVRVIYYVIDDSMPLFALLIYGKNEQEDLTPEQYKRVTTITAVVKSGWKASRDSK